VLAAGLVIAAFFAAWALLHVGFYRYSQIRDTPIYQRYGDAIARGQVPYRDFPLEYPPAALPVFAIPSLLRPRKGDLANYRNGFEAELLVLGALTLAFMLAILLRLDADPRRLRLALGFAALAPLALGSVELSRFDLWPTALTAGALAALLAERGRLGAGLLGIGFAAKLYPAVLLPLALTWAWRRRGRREAAVLLGAFAAAGLACFLPFLVLSPHGLWEAITRQTNRPLQIETLSAGVLLVAHAAGGLGIAMQSSHGSQNLAGTAPDVLAAAQTVAQLASVAAVWVWFARGPAERERLIRAWALALCTFVALGKVLSPQFLIWLIPFVPLVRGRRGLVASGLLGLALVLTQVWFPFRYWSLALDFAVVPSWLVLARDLVLVALVAALALPATRLRFAASR
jgi:hypothetical protein